MVEIKVRLDKDDHYEGGNTKEFIVVHDTGNKNDSDEGNANYFCTGSRGASAHYFVDDDSITQIVEDDDCSFHCGDGHNEFGINNKNSIGIEQCRKNGVVTNLTAKNTLELIVKLMKKHKIPLAKVVRHYDASKKNCPSSFNLDGKWTKWFEFKRALQIMLVPPPKIIAPKPVIGLVTASTLNVRSGCATAYPVVGTLKKGATVVVVGSKNGWSAIRCGNITGFVYTKYLKIQ